MHAYVVIWMIKRSNLKSLKDIFSLCILHQNYYSVDIGGIFLVEIHTKRDYVHLLSMRLTVSKNGEIPFERVCYVSGRFVVLYVKESE